MQFAARKFKIIVALLLLFTLVPVTGTCKSQGTDIQLDFALPVPAEAAHRAYLGLEPGDSFTLDRIQSPIILVEIFSMYCPICQREAKDVNRVYELITTSDTLAGQVRMIGIGAGNSAFEVDFFQKNYHVPFPLFSDGDFRIHKKIGEKGTPFFIGLKKGPGPALDIFFTWSGDIKDIQAFLDDFTQKAGLTP